MNTTRRTVLKGGAAVAALGAPLAVLSLNTETANPDAHLEALHAEWRAAEEASYEASSRADDATMAFYAQHPNPTIEVVNSKGETFTCASWEDICRASPATIRQAMRALRSRTKEEGKLSQEELVETIVDGMEPGKQLQLEAYERLHAAQAERRVAMERSEVGHLKRLGKEADAREDAAFETFLSTPAATSAGVLLKLRAAEGWIRKMHCNLEGVIDEPLDIEARLTLSALADLEHLAEGAVS